MADFEKHAPAFAELGVRVVAASVDGADDAREAVRDLALAFPVGYGLDAVAIATTYGCFYDPDDPYLHATGFVVDPSGTLALAAYSTGPIGRLTAADTLAFIAHNKSS